ncbi:protein Star-like [Palaemon carinicauda]|uniref:protein Star-like n=1 Tax=Palaemon carinicauda TaxID=392227 RepID=UPI0035B58FD0
MFNAHYLYLTDRSRSTAKSNELVAFKNSLTCVQTPYDFRNADQEDPALIEYIRSQLLVPPSVHKYSIETPDKLHFSQHSQSEIAKEFLGGMKDGFFVEVGAADGEWLSNTLFFERELGWRGLLIEATPKFFESLQKKNRKAYTINVALSVTTYATELTFQTEPRPSRSITKGNGTVVKGIPFYSIFRALNVEVVDFLSMDIESFEYKVLNTIPWDKIRFRLMCIEVNHIPEGKAFLTKFLQEKGYKFLGYKWLDAWFAHPSLLNIDEKS